MPFLIHIVCYFPGMLYGPRYIYMGPADGYTYKEWMQWTAQDAIQAANDQNAAFGILAGMCVAGSALMWMTPRSCCHIEGACAEDEINLVEFGKFSRFKQLHGECCDPYVTLPAAPSNGNLSPGCNQ